MKLDKLSRSLYPHYFPHKLVYTEIHVAGPWIEDP